MSQHYFETLHQGEMTEVLMGWDQLCQGFFLVISKQSDEEEPFYSNLYEKNPHPQNLDYFLGVLKRFDITIPQTMINGLWEDKRSNAGNKHVSHFSDQHTGEKTC